jgi:hypothetical protein
VNGSGGIGNDGQVDVVHLAVGGGGDLSSAELVADLALSYADERDPQRAPLVLQIVAGAIAAIPGTIAAAVETLDTRGALAAPISAGDDVARAVREAQIHLGDAPSLRALLAISSWTASSRH